MQYILVIILTEKILNASAALSTKLNELLSVLFQQYETTRTNIQYTHRCAHSQAVNKASKLINYTRNCKQPKYTIPHRYIKVAEADSLRSCKSTINTSGTSFLALTMFKTVWPAHRQRPWCTSHPVLSLSSLISIARYAAIPDIHSNAEKCRQ
jgi:hypothetical protein